MAEAEKNHFKILLLGAGESGKSTVVKQVKVIYKGGVSQKEKEEYTTAIRRNVIETMQNMIEAMDTLGIKYTDEKTQAMAVEFAKLDGQSTLSETAGFNVDTIWRDKGVQECYGRRDEYYCLDASKYYFDNASRIGEDDYAPSDEDMIMTRVRTTGIVLTEFDEAPQKYLLVDVGGQRSERRKWINCFDDVKAIIFLEGLSSYNQVLFEDASVNRMHESLTLFKEVVSNPVFESTPIFLFLNKKDLFEQMIKETPLSKCFEDYKGEEGTAMPALDHIKSKYNAIMEEACPGKEFPIHIVAASVRMDMKIAFGDVKERIKELYKGKGLYQNKSSRRY
jgi:GTPase SAR1 family protein